MCLGYTVYGSYITMQGTYYKNNPIEESDMNFYAKLTIGNLELSQVDLHEKLRFLNLGFSSIFMIAILIMKYFINPRFARKRLNKNIISNYTLKIVNLPPSKNEH